MNKKLLERTTFLISKVFSLLLFKCMRQILDLDGSGDDLGISFLDGTVFQMAMIHFFVEISPLIKLRNLPPGNTSYLSSA
jgi:hypothetical protein